MDAADEAVHGAVSRLVVACTAEDAEKINGNGNGNGKS